MDNKNNTKKKVIITILALVLVAIGVLFALKGCQKEEPVVHTHSYSINEEGTWICKDDNDILSNTDKPYVAILDNNQPKDILAIDSLSKTKINLGNGTIYKDGSNIYYSGNNAQTIIIKTQKVDDKQKDKDALVINAPQDTVYHYGSSTVISLDAVATNSFHEYGKVDLITLTKARVVLENKSDVKEIYLDVNDSNYSYETTIIALKENVELPRLTRDAVDLEEGEVKTLAIVQKLKDEVKTETNEETNEVIETVLEVQTAEDDYVKIENVRKSNDELIIEAFLSPNADELDKTQTETQTTSTITLEEAKEGSSHPASHNTFVPKQEKVTEVIKPTETKEEQKQEETKPVVTPTKKEETKPEVTSTEEDTPSKPSHSHSYGNWYDLDASYHAKKCSCGDTVKEEHDIDTNGVCKKCGHNAKAKIGNVYYETLEDAVDAADGVSVTITLLTNIDLTYYAEDDDHCFLLEDDTLDLNGFSITANNLGVSYDGDNMTIKNGKLIGANGASYGAFIGDAYYGDRISTGIVLEDIETVGGINVWVASVTIKELNATKASGTKYYAIWGDEAAVITVESGTFTSPSTIGGKVIHAYDGSKGGEPALVTIKGGTYAALSGSVEMFGEGINYIKVEGGVFNRDPSANLAPGYIAKENTPSEGKWTVEKVEDKEICVTDSNNHHEYMSLSDFRNNVNSGNNYSGYTITLLKNIDLQGDSWDPIGSIEWYNNTARPGYDTTSAKPFSGIFNGNEHTISNMTIDENSTINGTAIKAGGFFGNATGATIQNLNFVGANVNLPNNELVGVVVGGVLGGDITMKNITIDNTSSVIASDNIGAIVGSAFGDYDVATAYFENIESASTVSSSGAAYMGMITGSIKGYKTITFKQCTNNGDIKLTGTPSNVTYGMVGGFVGYLQGNTPRSGMSPTTNDTIVEFISCTNNGELLGYNNAGGMVANILGGNQLDTVSFTSCTNSGKVSVINGGNTGSTGGMFGYAGDNKGITFTQCTNSGNIGDANSKLSAGLFAWSQAPVTATENSISGTIVASVSPASAYALGYIQTPAKMTESNNSNNTGLSLHNE